VVDAWHIRFSGRVHIFVCAGVVFGILSFWQLVVSETGCKIIITVEALVKSRNGPTTST